MAALLVERLSQSKTSIVTAVRVIEVALLSTGLIYTILMNKGAVFPSPYDFVLSRLRKSVSFFSSWWNSPFYIYIFMNIIVILIALLSLFHPPIMDSNSDIEDGGGDSTHEDYDLQGALSPSLSLPPDPPPMQNNHNYHLQDRKRKDMAIAAPAAVATMAISTTKTNTEGGKLTMARTSLKKKDITEVEIVVECQQQAVFSDFSRLAKAKEIKKAQTTNDGGKIRTTKQNTRDKHIAKVTDHHDSVQAIFADLPKLGESKEIREVNSLESSKQVESIQNATQDNQTMKQLGNADGDEDNDTMEATWRAINGGTKPQENQLKKSKTSPKAQKLMIDQELEDNIELPVTSSDGEAVAKQMWKSMTFNDTVSILHRGGLRRGSVNLEEFNQRVEAFIQKFYHEMRLQRQESDQRYLDMINRGL